jgi:uncharacterized alkaline shock family protein YloU
MEDKDRVIGNVVVSEDVISSIAASVAFEVEGVANLHHGLTGGLVEKFGKKNTKGIRVVQKDDAVTIELTVDVEFGVQIQKVAEKIQRKVKNAVEAMTCSRVMEVNVNVEGVRMTPKQLD